MKSFAEANILIIDSVQTELTVSLMCNGHTYAEVNTIQKSHDKNLNPMVTKVLSAGKIGFPELDAIAVVVGPGSWTGCRVGVAAVKGYSAVRNLPIIAIKSLDVVESLADGKVPAIKCNLDNYFIKRGGEYLCQKLDNLYEYFVLQDLTGYRTELFKAVKSRYNAGHFITALELVPFYITDFVVKT
jgi:tRNA A37 threonylcarbamoyladenosine modification protein TsaB